MKFHKVVTIAHKVAIDPHSPVKNKKTVEITQYMKLKSERAIVAKTMIDPKATTDMMRKLIHGATMSTSTPPMIPEK